MKSPFDLLPSITSGKFPFEPYPGATGVIGLVFQNTDTTYKFFWFLSLLDKVKVADFKVDLRVEIKELAREMVAQVWPCRRTEGTVATARGSCDQNVLGLVIDL